ncbi:hypothetical protein RND71_032109 [Anisodus tanguticus]|uniref:Uncharacterized protein n=1 Tax=Anisodus tanguticus TaxID=243964 RepID=A0AAE1RDN3_9SOLA|nr:hypothetical protein RND71_032109 [Anisodus tanguticus]
MMMMEHVLTQLGPAIATIVFVWTMYQNYFPHEIRGHIKRYTDKIVSYFYPYTQIIFHKYDTDGWYERSKAYVAIERYLSKNSSTQAKRLKDNTVKDGQFLVLTMADHEEVTDEYKGEKVGKAWKCGYLLHGPPGIALKDNTKIRKLLIDTISKSIVMIEDIDCSLDLTGQREKKKDEKEEEKDEKDAINENVKKLGAEKKQSEIHHLLKETNTTPADVAENLIPKSIKENVDTCLERLIKAIETDKDEARLKAME